MITLWATLKAAARFVWRSSLPDGGPHSDVSLKKIQLFQRVIQTLERERSRLMKRQVAQEGQVDVRGAADPLIDRVGLLLHLIGEFEQGERHVGFDGHVKLGLSEGGNDKGTVADAARDS